MQQYYRLMKSILFVLFLSGQSENPVDMLNSHCQFA